MRACLPKNSGVPGSWHFSTTCRARRFPAKIPSTCWDRSRARYRKISASITSASGCSTTAPKKSKSRPRLASPPTPWASVFLWAPASWDAWRAPASGHWCRMRARASFREFCPTHARCFAFPITYGENLLGALNIESRNEYAFAPQDVLILNTLADLLATALHNAFVFQKLQQQSITDGLT